MLLVCVDERSEEALSEHAEFVVGEMDNLHDADVIYVTDRLRCTP